MDEILNEIRAEIAILQEQLGTLRGIGEELDDARQVVREHIDGIRSYVIQIADSSERLNQKYESFAADVRDACLNELKKAESVLRKAEEIFEENAKELKLKYESFAAELKDASIAELRIAGEALHKASELLAETRKALKEELQRSIDTNEEVAKRGKEVFDLLEGLGLGKRLDRIDDHLKEQTYALHGLKEIINERIGALSALVEKKVSDLEHTMETRFEHVNHELSQIQITQKAIEKSSRTRFYVTVGIGVIALALLILIKWGG